MSYLAILILLQANTTIEYFLDVNYTFGSLIALLTGLTVTIFTWYPCLPSYSTNERPFAFAYFAILITLLTLTTVSLFTPLGFPYQLKSGLKNGIISGMQSFNGSNLNGITANCDRSCTAFALQTTQATLECCGWLGADDYLIIMATSRSIPSSCGHRSNFTTARPFTLRSTNGDTFKGCRYSSLYQLADKLEFAYICQFILLAILTPLTWLIIRLSWNCIHC